MTEPFPSPVPPPRVTTADIARASGVSRTTVSYVLNQSPTGRVSERTRALVRQTALELGHYPSAAGRSLRLGRSNVVLALLPEFSMGHVGDAVIRALDVALASHGYVVLALRYDPGVRNLTDLWGFVSPSVIVAAGSLSAADRLSVERSPATFVSVSGILPIATPGRMQVDHLASRGHARLGYAHPVSPQLAGAVAGRLAGVQERCRELGMPAPREFTIDTDDPGSAGAMLDALGTSGERITAICAHNDDVALLIEAELAARGMHAPDDLAVIGVDDIPAGRGRLTTVGIDTERFGAAVVEQVVALIEGRDATSLDGDGLFRLMVRSTA